MHIFCKKSTMNILDLIYFFIDLTNFAMTSPWMSVKDLENWNKRHPSLTT